MDSSSSDSNCSSHQENGDERQLQECFVLRRVSESNPVQETPKSPKSKRKMEQDDGDDDALPPIWEDEPYSYRRRRLEAFHHVWSHIEKSIQEALSNLNNTTFEEICQWIDGSAFANNTMPNSLVVKQLATAMLFTRNVEFVDDRTTFQELCLYLKSNKYHVAHLSPKDFLPKSGLGGCVRNLLKQIIMINPDTPDMEILASWHSEVANKKNPIIVVIEDVERCNPSILADFIRLLSEWVIHVPIVLVMGMATTVDALRKVLPSGAIQHLHPQRFNLKHSLERLESVISVLSLESYSGFYFGHNVAKFLYKFFTREDGTLTSILRALKIACMEHFSSEPLSFLCKELMQDLSEEDIRTECVKFPAFILKYAAELPSVKMKCTSEIKEMPVLLAAAILEIKKSTEYWSIVLSCLHDVGNYAKVPFMDLFCEALCSTNTRIQCEEVGVVIPHTESITQKSVTQILRKLRDLSWPLLFSLLQSWEKRTKGLPEIHREVQRLQQIIGCDENGKIAEGSRLRAYDHDKNKYISSREKDLKKCQDFVASSAQDYFSQSSVKTQALIRTCTNGTSTSGREDAKAVSDMVSKLLQRMIRQYLRPIESMSFHEMFCYKRVDTLQSALIGHTRKTVQTDLIHFQQYLKCTCCKDKIGLYHSMHDTSLLYALAQEHGDVINVYDWYQSFKTIMSRKGEISVQTEKQKCDKKLKFKRKHLPEDQCVVQARFSKAITELQITGLLKMPSKRRPDYIQRIAFGS